MEFFKKHKFSFYSIVVLISTIIMFILIHVIYGNYFEYSEWIKFCVGSLISILGFVATIFTIKLTIRTMDEKKRNNKLKKRKIAIILNYEINNFLVSIFDTFYICLIDWASKDFNRYGNPEVNFSYLNKLSNDFKEMLYELISIDEDAKSLEIFEFFKVYQQSIKRTDEGDAVGVEPLIDIFKFCFKEEYHEYVRLTGIRYNGRFTRALPLTEEQQKSFKEFYDIKKNLYLNKDKENLLKNEYSKRIIEIFSYLNNLKS
ncbi:hypothetical protein ACQPUH_01695 [Clostridium perfringens]|uniref:hypothetical protein n=1 Tax=Clostridium perfringens TaxID=1502 RepID=UPI0018E4D4FB|nr:hypothetical protein [Clostridium perfringens]MBI6017017.1 hypothetical protein [Clostridium perfringens]MDK0588572.1 hypothetical protein [Clostridium perfringens]MDM0527341.1 hypothetical protein [Clostridium perfringens]MDM0529206.1 hypothetical protein [Clostridium perfringens]MDM0539327.1 hypothetical protein [Clostridium perfringens]